MAIDESYVEEERRKRQSEERSERHRRLPHKARKSGFMDTLGHIGKGIGSGLGTIGNAYKSPMPRHSRAHEKDEGYAYGFYNPHGGNKRLFATQRFARNIIAGGHQMGISHTPLGLYGYYQRARPRYKYTTRRIRVRVRD